MVVRLKYRREQKGPLGLSATPGRWGIRTPWEGRGHKAVAQHNPDHHVETISNTCAS